MEKFLTKKWIGPVALVIYVVIVSLVLSNIITSKVEKFAPVILKEADYFLPITVHNGEITNPYNTVIDRSYTIDGETLHIVLDTRTDSLDVTTLPGEGFYFSKKCSYSVSNDETRSRCLKPTDFAEPLTITSEKLKDFVEAVIEYTFPVSAIILFISLLIGLYIAILFFTCIMHWFVALFFKTSFGQTLFINTLAYMGLSLLEIATPLSLGFWATLLLLILINLGVCKNANERKTK